MGACFSCQHSKLAAYDPLEEETDADDIDNDIVLKGNAGARVLLRGSSKYVSMFTRKGKKSINQDAMTVWENFLGDKDMFFCAVFDGHGPSGHKVAHYIRDFLPAKIYLMHKQSSRGQGMDTAFDLETPRDDAYQSPLFLSWKARLEKGFREMDEQLERETSIESYCSGSTTVCVLKKHEHLVIANLGDSRAVLCTRDDNDMLVSEQLTLDLKPSVPSEADRVKGCSGRVKAMQEEPNVYRVWMPNEDSPGLAMTRSFGDFCLKDYGVISTPQVTYRKLTEKDEFVVLATDGIWDALPNKKVVRIVASARNRSMAARLLVEKATRAWRRKNPRAKIDDCTAVCLFFNREKPVLQKSYSDVAGSGLTGLRPQSCSRKSHDALDTLLNFDVTQIPEGTEAEREPEHGGVQEGVDEASPRRRLGKWEET